MDADGVIVFRNAFSYIFNRVRELVAPGKQSPKLYEPLDSAGDLPLLKYAVRRVVRAHLSSS